MYYFSSSLVLFLSNLAFASAVGCGDADACIGTEVCTTVTFTTPSATTITTCVPTPTCLGVYSDCVLPDNTLGNCCSGYCAANKCRPTDPNWPNCQEGNGPCLSDANCCYGNQCVNGLCTRKQACGA
ncbi:hypothetical protein N7462_010516 [Penicillium macrosclerotiorum]|uniref:uncharacterized protein n=1 Tax=Penicillium macrosclerotiorum TaxID=303699 RepID=UPI002547D520|nr:uncharacterized protein N7462_010516 [Penicillium macrosclerotiorum]KAJ5669446.1 hypothetical protein N7462_010516 [Penicillium macrosclerotiorum]